MQRLWKWIKRSFVLGTELVLAAVCFGAAYQVMASHFEWNAFHLPGRRIDVGGYRLYLYCQGQGNPTIVVSPGVGVWSLQWSKIQGALAQDTRVCTYDRAGYGWSDLGVSTPTAKQAADELHVLLQKSRGARTLRTCWRILRWIRHPPFRRKIPRRPSGGGAPGIGARTAMGGISPGEGPYAASTTTAHGRALA